MHLQPAAAKFGYSKGDFPICEQVCDNVFSLPVHEFINKEQMAFVVQKIKEFYIEFCQCQHCRKQRNEEKEHVNRNPCLDG